MTNIEIKNQLIELCKSEIQRRISLNEKLMNQEQETANQYKGAMESRYDTFKEEAQSRKDTYAMQIDKLMKLNSALLTIGTESADKIKFGVVIETSLSDYFIFSYLFDEPVKVHGKNFLIISLESPIGIALKNKKINDTFIFNGKEYRINNIY